MSKENYIEEDEIDLRELFKTIWDRKIFILLFTFIITFCSIFYVYFKNPIPIYQGKVLIEIGEIQSESFAPQPLDNSNDLSEILKAKLNINSSSVRGTHKLLEIYFQDNDKKVIKENLQKAVDFIIQRGKEKSTFYKNVIMTKQIGEIKVSNIPINKPKKKLIVTVSFVTAFILSIFLVFFMDFIKAFNLINKY